MTKPTLKASTHHTYSDAYLKGILKDIATIALVGSSNNPDRPSHQVMKYLLEKGYNVIPVNPLLAAKEIAGQKVIASLSDIKVPIDMVDVFRKSEAVSEVVEEALHLSPLPKYIWLQIGVTDLTSARRAEAKGIKVIMNRCPKIEFERLIKELPQGAGKRQ